ncbi:MAG: glutathione S-transferase domain-containing protein [Alphaproteobacteria bacterium]|nr:MAG: glutathione S-transferase domain-containing protein [Caulobacteraceae bacterium]TPW04361.1 MAG: glutathione S-transferase domain-containing protein [Alphaproteobacteria bacterium]
MKLLYSPTSPYARKVRITVIEKGLADRVEIVGVDVLGKPDTVRASNPLAKIPALVLDDGTSLFDSPVICEYLDTLAPTPVLLPKGAARWGVLRRQALADGVMDAAFNLVMERRRPEALRSEEWMARWTAAMSNAIAALDAELPAETPAFDLGWIAAIAAVDYVEFRLGDLGLLKATAKLAAWRALMADRPSVAASAPPKG